MRRVAFAVALLLLCVAAKPRREYLRSYEAHTRHLIVYWDFETALNLRATYLTPRMREAIAAERSRLLGPAAGPPEDYLRTLMSDGEAYHEIVFSADSAMEEGDSFGDDDEGWRLRLEADGVEEPLVTVFRVRDPNPMQRALYPHFNIWSELWIARFARNVRDPGEVVLYLGSGYGHGQLRWELGPEGAERGR